MVLVRVASMFFALKYLSRDYGSDGFGIISQVMGVGALFTTLAGGGNVNGIVREISASANLDEKAAWLRAAMAVCLWSSLILGAAAAVLYFGLTEFVFRSKELAWVFVLIGVCQVGTSFGNTAAAFLSGAGAIRDYAIAGSIGSILSALLIMAGSIFGGFEGAVAGAAIFGLAPALIALVFLATRHKKVMSRCLSVATDRKKVRVLLSYSLVMLIAIIAVPMALVFMRSGLSRSHGWAVVGQWQSVARIGEAYMQFFGLMLSSVLLPRLSATPEGARMPINRNFSILIIAIFAAGASVFYWFSGFILQLIYSSEFVPAAAYVAPQLLADFLKIGAAMFVFQHLASGKPFLQGVGEVIQALVMALAFVWFVPIGGLSAVWAYVAGSAAALMFFSLYHYRSRSAAKF
jgi:O-antigen/teichoic acid export membrane protein